ncbi:Ion transport domain protein [Kalmanozyma brasiliensis GHG001]|uniref:Ion transport domain protein n=1 Tax=Kalmanozyma brasiliensis (strain GHG001) TaxID=1365824 RepID=UPI001CE8F7B3|nr:Ion transport domain protein [Kalmanozyma brasiliensis GHG001]EST08271.2 Ion transport domain protein [Kalmanozyma brasiliensis GHG001]
MSASHDLDPDSPQHSQSQQHTLHPPPVDPMRSPTSPHPRDSISASSIPSHNSDIYINSYYYGNEDMSELAGPSSAPAPPAWTSAFGQSPLNSPHLTNSNDQRLLRRLSWDSGHDHHSNSQTAHSRSHQRDVSLADAGILSGPLQLSPEPTSTQFPSSSADRFPQRSSSLPLASPHHTIPLPFSSQLMDQDPSRESDATFTAQDHDRAYLTSPHDGKQRRSVRYQDAEEHYVHRTASPGEIEGAEGSGFTSSADAYAASNLDKARSGLNRFSKSFRRMSRRVVHHRQQGHIPLTDQDAHDSDSSGTANLYHQPSTADEITPATHQLQLLRGKSLGIWSPESRLRKSLAGVLAKWWIEPLVLLLILANTVTLVVQSARSVYSHPPPARYFGDVTDYILLAIFACYTIEMVARIIVSGLIINPPPLYAAPIPVAADDHPDQQDLKEAVPILTEHRRQMSRSNTLEAFGTLGDSLKQKAQRVLAGEEGFTESALLSRRPSSGPSHPNDASYTKADAYDTSIPDGQIRHVRRQLNQSETSAFLSETSVPSFWQNAKTPFAEAFERQRVQAVHHAYLRHSWNRVDSVAVIAFWIAFGLSMGGQESTDNHHIYIFRALSVLRCARLLTATSGTTTILHSLKMSAFILLAVSFFTGFAMLLFGIIGIQSFEGSYRRNCVWVGDLNNQPGNNNTLSQLCGGYFNTDGQKLGHVLVDGSPSRLSPKGFICPRGQVCQEQTTNPQTNTQSFDNIATSLLEVVILISSNNWSQTMYDMIDADYYASVLYFIFGIILLNFWLANLFVAVITNSFATITARTQRSAFADQKLQDESTEDEKQTQKRGRFKSLAVGFKRVWGYTKYLWILAIIADISIQASRAIYLGPAELEKRSRIELYFTLAFDFEIVMRFLAFVLDGDWRGFLRSKQNRADLFLAVITSLIQIPVIKNSQVYPWLTFFQLARFYRVIAAIPRMRVLLFRAFGSLNKMLNMVLFLLLMVGLASLIATQLFRGDIPQESDGEWTQMTFKHSFNSFLAMYQIFTSENWTNVLFSAASNEVEFKQAAIAAIFLSGWFLFANFIVLQMFIAVINENFGVAEHEKRQQQLEQYLRRNEPPPPSLTGRLVSKLSPYRWLKRRNAAASEHGRSDHGSSAGGQTSKIVGGSRMDKRSEKESKARPMSIHHVVESSTATAHSTMNTVRKLLRLDQPDEEVPLDNLHARRLRSSMDAGELLNPSGLTPAYDADPSDQAARQFARERRLQRMRSDLGLASEGNTSSKVFQPHSYSDARIQQAQFIATHPSYDKSYFLFSNHNRFRRFCQTLVPPSHGERLFGRQVSPFRHKLFQIAVFMGIVGSVVSAAIATPVYRRDYYARYGLIRASWFSILEISLSSLFFSEFLVKTIADGLAFTSNAYVLSVWNSLDLFVLITLLINVITELAVIGGVSRFTRALKAFRALRLINLSALMRDTFHAVMIAGAGRILDASILSILYIIPYAIWGQNLFAGLLYSCNDGSNSIQTKFDCSGEYSSSPGNFNFLAPRVWGNPTEGSVYSFDDFKGAMLILFEIISLEGWIDVMTAAMSVAGRDQQLQNDNRQVNALFFLIYNLVGSTTVLTLFVSVIIENFQTFSGAAFQTAGQRQWVDLRRLVMRQRPSKRPKRRPTQAVRAWCYDRMLNKNGWWSRTMTMVYLATLVTLMTQQYSDPAWANQLRDALYLGYITIYAFDIVARLLGLGWRSYRENPWNLYDLFVVAGTLATTLPLLAHTSESGVVVQFQKLFLTLVALKLVQKNHALNQLFKTAFASLPAILSLFLLWLTMFLVWAIMLLEVFGLTKWGPNETYSRNFSTFISSLVFLSMMSTGEGWNSFMHDYVVSPPRCTPAASYLMTDCGSEPWAYALFIGWNVISMYIFLNMFTGTVVENFSYIFDLGSKAILTPSDIRHFKSSWATFDRQRKGYIQRDQIVPFLSSVKGALEVGLYPPECSLRSLRAALDPDGASQDSRPDAKGKGALKFLKNAASELRSPMREGHDRDGKGAFEWPQSPSVQGHVPQADAERLAHALSMVDAKDLRMRRERFNRLYHEAIMLIRPRKGISFTDMFLLLARTKLVDETEALNVEELIERKDVVEKIDHQVRLDRVRGLLQMSYWRRRFLALQDEMHKGGEAVPTILLHESPGRPPKPVLSALDIPGSSASAQTRSRPALTLTPTQPSRHDLELRASPVIESFEATAWGDLMKRIDGSQDGSHEGHGEAAEKKSSGKKKDGSPSVKHRDDDGWV